MKKVFLFVTMCVLTLSLAAQGNNVAKVERQKDGFASERVGNEVWEGNYADGQKQGLWVKYNDKKLVRGIVEYKNGEKHGLELIFDRNGYISADNHYVDGQLHGICKTYLHGTSLLTSISYVNGKYDGLYESYYRDKPSQKLQETFYKYGLKDGKSVYYSPNGKPIAEYSYSADKFNGVNKTFWENGNLKIEEVYENDVPVGEYKEYFDDGMTIKVKGAYKNGLKEGTWLEYNLDGQQVKKMQYSKGNLK